MNYIFAGLSLLYLLPAAVSYFTLSKNPHLNHLRLVILIINIQKYTRILRELSPSSSLKFVLKTDLENWRHQFFTNKNFNWRVSSSSKLQKSKITK